MNTRDYKMAATAACDEQGEDENDREDRRITTDTAEDYEEKVAKGRHYMVFAFQNLSGKHKSIPFCCCKICPCKGE